jgi:hypothetical protein
MIGDPGEAFMSASYKEQTVSNFEERSGPAEGKVSMGAKYTINGFHDAARLVNHHMQDVLVS